MAESDQKRSEKPENTGISYEDDEEIICSACGFSSAFVPEGMITCSRCFVAYYCSKECRDWEYASGGHDKVCQPVVLSSIPTKASNTSVKSDGLLGDSFNNSDGGSTSHASIDVLHLFEKQRSPFLSKNKILQSFTAKSIQVAPRNLPDPISQRNLYIPKSPHSEVDSQVNPSNFKQPSTNQTVSGTLGTFLEATSSDRPVKDTISSVFLINQSNNEGSDEEDDDDENVNMRNFMKLYTNQHSENVEDESVGLSVLKDESAADLTVIAEESNVMSGPVIEASWRHRNSTISTAVSTGTASALDMSDSGIIGVTETYLMSDINSAFESSTESLSSLNSNQDIHENSAVLNLLSVCTSINSESLGHLEENELDYSEGTDSISSHQADPVKTESREHPDIVESSNSTATSDVRVSEVGTLGRPAPIQRGPSLRGFRDAYNECDTTSLHSRSLARSSSLSEKSLSSHGSIFEKGSDLPERLNRSSSSLKDFRDIYNADLDRTLLPHHSCSSLCSSSIGFDDHPSEVPVKAPNDSDKNDSVVEMSSQNGSNSGQKTKDLSSQLLSLSLEQGKTKPSQSITGQRKTQRSPSSRSGDDSALQMARLRNESMKESLNSALRAYEQLYGEDAAKDVFYQLTNKIEPNSENQEQPSGEQTFDWKRSRSFMKDAPPSISSVLRNDKSVPNDGVNAPDSLPRYMKYRTSLSATSLSESHTCQDENKIEIHTDVTNCENSTEAACTSRAPARTSSYSQYRSKLSADTAISPQVENVEKELRVYAGTFEPESIGSITRPSMDDKKVTVTALPSNSRYESYRTSLSNMSTDYQKDPNGIGDAKPRNEIADEAHVLSNAPKQQILTSTQSSNVLEYKKTVAPRLNVLTTEDVLSTDFESRSYESGTNAAVCRPMILSNGLISASQPSERNAGYLKYRQMLGKVDTDDGLEGTFASENMQVSQQQSIAPISDKIAEESKQSYAETAPDQRYLQYRSSLQKSASEDCFESNLETVPTPTGGLPTVYGLVQEKNDAVEATSDHLPTEGELCLVRGKSEKPFASRYMKYRASLLQYDVHDRQTLSHDNSTPHAEVASTSWKVVNNDSLAPVDRLRKNGDPVSNMIRDNAKYELKAHGVSPSMCSMANTEELLKVWNEVESDRKRLNSQRFIGLKESANPQILTVFPPHETPNERNLVVMNKENDYHMDIEAGKILVPSNSGCSEDAMKQRAKKHQLKQSSWCGFLIFVLVALPIGIGLGIGLTRSEPTIERKPVIVQTPSASPTAKVSQNKPIHDQNQGMTYSPVVSPISNVPDRTSMPVASMSAPTQQPTKRPSLLPVASPVSSLPTQSPIVTNSTQSPTIFQPEKSIELYSLLVNVSADNGAAIKSSGSPQSLAFQWLASSPDLFLDFSDARIIQRYALATLYFSTDGPRWLDNIRWLSEVNECLWYTMTTQQNCDDENMYLNLNLGSNDLTGVIPNELTMLARLQSLTLSGGPTRFLGGFIPSALGTMTRLTLLDLQANSLFGGIPPELCDLEKLEVLDLSLNRLARTIPSDIGRLTPMKSFNLAMNDLSGIIPTSIKSLTQLQKISLGNNNLVGQVGIGSSLGLLTEFNVENNRFTSIGTEIGLLTGLRTLTLYDNDIVGSLPTQIGNLTVLQRLDLHKNELTGSIPTEVGALVLLTDLDLSLNNFTSSIPTEIGLLTSLAQLNLQSNLLEGPIPNELGKLNTTSVIKINDNNITGEISQELCDQFGFITPIFYADCLQESDGTTKLACPSDSCCTFCCNEQSGCVCGLQGTTFAVFCNM
jgi:hypothetical protein